MDVIPEKADKINRKISPIQDEYIEKYLKEKELNLTATLDGASAYKDANFSEVFISNMLKRVSSSSIYCSHPNFCGKAWRCMTIFIPVVYPKLIESLEFKDENKAIREIANIPMLEKAAQTFAGLLQQGGAIKKDIPTLFMGMKEAEAVTLFANTYLALRVSYFNELDTYAEVKGLDSQAIIEGIGLDPRIGTHHNNPSLGYGGSFT